MKHWMILCAVMALCSVSVSASTTEETIKVGLRYGDAAMFSANLENHVGSGYALGYYDEGRTFVPVSQTEEIAISMTKAGSTIYMDEAGNYSDVDNGGVALGVYHIELAGDFDAQTALDTAGTLDGAYPGYIDARHVVRLGHYTSEATALEALDAFDLDATVVRSGADEVVVTRTRTDHVLFAYSGELGVLPLGDDTQTWFRGNRYYGGFSYQMTTAHGLDVVNMVALDDYTQGVLPYEMGSSAPQAALEAQAVCARTYALEVTGHARHRFDVCSTVDCQVYYGLGGGDDQPAQSIVDAVDNTAGLILYHDGQPIKAVYSASNGGASEDAANVWGSDVPYLQGKVDPYEQERGTYTYSETYTAQELTDILHLKEYDIGFIDNVYVSAFTDLGNVYQLTFVDTAGKTLTVSRETCRTIFYSSALGKSVESMRYTINGGGGSSVAVNQGDAMLSSLEGVQVVRGSGGVETLDTGDVHIITAHGVESLHLDGPSDNNDGVFTISGTGSGHNVGMSQRGAMAMADLGYTFEDILTFYYTDVTIAPAEMEN